MFIQDLLLIFTASLTFVIGLLIGIRDKRNTANIMYLFLTLAMSVWAVSLLMFRIYNANEISEFFARLSYIAGLLMVIFFYLFSHYFPYSDRVVKRTTKIALILASGVICFLMLATNVIVQGVRVDNGVVSAVTNLLAHSIYGAVLVVFLILGCINFYRKISTSDGDHRRQLNLIFIMSLIAAFFGVFFDIVLPILGDYRWNWLGPQFLILLTFAVGIIIFGPRLISYDKT